MARISIFGLGYVGLATAVCLTRKGHEVVGIDPDREKVEKIQGGMAPFFEPDLDASLKKAVDQRALTASTGPSLNSQSEIAYITVGTPSNSDGSINLGYVQAAARDIGRSLRNKRGYQLIVIKSTVTPGTARNIVRPAVEKESGRALGTDFGLCSNPEFLREGRAIYDTENPDRIIIGGDNAHALSLLEQFYQEYHKPNIPPIIKTTHENAELIKYANNAFLAAKISFINTIANIAEKTPNANVTTIAKSIGLDERIGPKFLEAGLGYGGSCFPKDLAALIAYSKSRGYGPGLIAATANTNGTQPFKAVQFAKKRLRRLQGKKIAVLGLAFKPNTADMREAVSIPIIKALLSSRAKVTAYDPAAKEQAKKMFRNRIQYASSATGCIKGAELAIVVTEWDEFKQLTGKDFVALMKTPLVYDGRRIFDPNEMKQAGVNYYALGLGEASRIVQSEP
jgi:UDPglucose 6-dehydrogenase